MTEPTSTRTDAPMGILDRLFRRPQQGTPSKEQFAKLLIEAIRAAGETRELVFELEHFKIWIADEPGQITYLTNLYAEYCAASNDRRNELLHSNVRTFFETQREFPECFEDASHDILPSLRTTGFFEGTVRRLLEAGATLEKAKAQKPAYLPLNEYLAIGLVYDLPDSMQFISGERLVEWGIDLFHAVEVARQNLERLGTAA